ncbi:MAG: hypothetical protein PHF64_00905 [Methanoregula sp.]|nr:hypothetical protein [Methanoregula sp.]
MVREARMTESTPVYRINLALDEVDKRTIDALMARGTAATISEAIRFCIKEQEKLL